MLPDESAPDGFAAEPGYVTDLARVFATGSFLDTDRAGELEAQMVMFRERAVAAEAAVMRLEFDLAHVRGELVIAEEALATVEADLDQAARLIPDPDETVVARRDLRDVLTVVALYTPLEVRPSDIMDRLAAAAGVQ
jgi:hypothetical protein